MGVGDEALGFSEHRRRTGKKYGGGKQANSAAMEFWNDHK
jgi:hypothetical protein